MSEAERRIQALLDQEAITVPRFPPESRYADTPLASLEDARGRRITHLRRRFVPQVDRFAAVREHAVEQGDRLDRLAQTYLGQAELYWRICDANGSIRPAELTDTIGRRIRITLPEGVPGGSDD
jgi:hypothetical protein